MSVMHPKPSTMTAASGAESRRARKRSSLAVTTSRGPAGAVPRTSCPMAVTPGSADVHIVDTAVSPGARLQTLRLIALGDHVHGPSLYLRGSLLVTGVGETRTPGSGNKNRNLIVSRNLSPWQTQIAHWGWCIRTIFRELFMRVR